MALWLRRIALTRTTIVRFPLGVEIFCTSLSHVTRRLTRASIAVLSNFFFLAFVSGDLALTGFDH